MSELVAGLVIGARYRLERRLGEGGMGVVWAATDVATDRPVAVKLMKATGDADARRRFLGEARAAAAVHHPHVVTILATLDQGEGSPAMVMELLDGESLRAVLARDGTLALGELAAILVPVISAVGAAHALGIVHRDLKPENIFLARRGQDRVVKVLDFGIAKRIELDDEAQRSTGVTTGALLGTPAYMAPEQVFGEHDLDHRADLWALGLIAYQALSGVLPTRGEHVGQILKHVLSKPFEPLDQLVPGLPADVARMVMRMLARERTQRPADLREVLAVFAPRTPTPAIAFGAPAGPAIAPREVQPPSRRSPRLRRRQLGIGGGVVTLIAAAAAWYAAQPAARAALLAAPSSQLACPIFRASGVAEPAGWLGAAAAAIACERARVVLGGRRERTRVPAELLDLPRARVDGFPADPYGAPEARARSLAAARRAAAYLDGDVVRQPAGYVVILVLHAGDGRELARATGQGVALYEAVREAMTPLVRADRIPLAAALDPVIATWSRAQDVGAALALLDLDFALAQAGPSQPDECARFDLVRGRAGEPGAAARARCAEAVGRVPPRLELDDSDPSPAAIAARIRIEHAVGGADRAGDADRVHALLSREPSPWGRAQLAATEACVLDDAQPSRGHAMARQATELEPRALIGEPCDPWARLDRFVMTTWDLPRAIPALEAWEPWNRLGWQLQGMDLVQRASSLAPYRRAIALAPLDRRLVAVLGDTLVVRGRLGEARELARSARLGGPALRAQGTALAMRIDASQARFVAVLDEAREALALAPDDAGWVRSVRFEAGWRALVVAGVLGHAAELADHLVQRFVDPEPTALDRALSAPERLAAVCALASPAVSARCFTRLRALRGRLSEWRAPADELLRGAECYARHDFAGAAAAWRPRLSPTAAPDPMSYGVVVTLLVPDALVDAFDRAGDHATATRIDDYLMMGADTLGGATLAHVRAARRAVQRGDRATARRLAQQVIDAWSNADETVPAVAEMRAVLARP
jgi:eukaryotic-like serine/threonine-protein kinase